MCEWLGFPVQEVTLIFANQSVHVILTLVFGSDFLEIGTNTGKRVSVLHSGSFSDST